MKHVAWIGMAAVTVMLTACSSEKETEANATLDSVEQKVSYIVGYNMASQAKDNNFDVDTNAISMAIADVRAGNESRFGQEETRHIMMEYQAQQQAAQKENMEKASAEKRKTGLDYLAENAKKDGVQTTESGLQYRVLQEGTGATPSESDQVTVHYTGRLIDGTVFDSSVERGEPATFPVSGVINGWVEALQMMQVGDKWELTIPYDLAYGSGGTSGPIGPYETLVFEVELLDVVTN